MENNNQEWEGFQSFAQDINSYYSHIGHSSKVSTNIKSQPTIAELKLSKTQIPTNTLHKKLITFKATKRPKYSMPQIEDPRKKIQKRNLATPKPLMRSQSIRSEKDQSKSKESPPKHKQDHIPIFRFPNFSQTGKLIYKGFLPTSATEYLQYSEWSINNKNSHGMAIDEKEVVFNSKFQSGNLDLVRKVNSQYHLYIAPDTNTKGHRQWFYFTVSSLKQRKIRIIIHGFKKSFSLFQKGMYPYGKKLEEPDQAWKPIGSNVKYLREQAWLTENRKKFLNKKGPQQYCLTFFLTMESNTTYCIASCIPYTYTLLNQNINNLHQSDHLISFRQRALCKTLLGLQIPLLTFNEKEQAKSQGYKYIIINSRTHPGESSSSWVVQGILDYLLESQAQIKIRKHKLIIKIVPMLNPDGVWMGNYRTGLMGIDFNRLFQSGSPNIFPQIQSLRQLVKQCKKTGKVDLYLDLHGHSINPGCFFYGPEPNVTLSSGLKQLSNRLKKLSYFSYRHCLNGSSSSKVQTSRVYFQLHEGIYSLTCQNSLGLYYKDTHSTVTEQCSIQGWKQFGRQLMKGILEQYKQCEKDKQTFPYEKFMYTQNMKIQQEQDIIIKRSKTDSQHLAEQLRKLQSLDSQDIQLSSPLKPKLKSQPSDLESMNDSDNDSDDLGSNRLEQLFSIVNNIVHKRGDSNTNYSTHKKWWFRDRSNRNQEKSHIVGNIKQYRFGYEDSTLSEWIAKKRMLSIPRVLKQEKINTSYIIRKSAPRATPSELIFESFDLYNRVKTEERESNGFKMHSKLNSHLKNNSFRDKI